MIVSMIPQVIFSSILAPLLLGDTSRLAAASLHQCIVSSAILLWVGTKIVEIFFFTMKWDSPLILIFPRHMAPEYRMSLLQEMT